MPQENLLGINERLQKLEYEQQASEREMSHFREEQKRQWEVTNDIKRDQALDRQRIAAMEKQLNKIDENTTATRRQLTGAFVSAIVTGVVGGAIALIYALIGSGVV